jgi:uncharacterized membrane protein
MTTLSGAVLGGAGLVAAATVAGAWLVRRHPGQQQTWFAAAAGLLLIVAGLHCGRSRYSPGVLIK